MSGQLVGEVIAASESLRARGLSESGFHALIAIAEKASTHDRTATVRWDHVCAGLYGKSKRTAERAVEDAKRLGVIEVVRTGFKNQYGTSRAPIYRIAPLLDHDTQVSVSTPEDHDTQVSVSTELDTDKPELDTDKSELDTDTQVSYLTFPYDVSHDGGRAPAGDDPPPHYCDDHPKGTSMNCIPCMHRRQARQRWFQDREERDARLVAERRRIREACHRCEGTGMVDVDDNSVMHCPDCSAWRTEARQ